MSIIVEAIYEDGSFRPRVPVGLANGAPVRLVVDVIEDDRDPLEEVIGVVRGGPDFGLAERHDEVLYKDPGPCEGPRP